MIRRGTSAALLVLAVAILACGWPLPRQVMEKSPVGAVQTPLAIGSPSPVTGGVSSPLPSPAPVNLLPRSLYFLNKNDIGLRQIFRLEADGRTLHQITNETAHVDSFAVSPSDGNLAYSSNNQLVLVDANGAGRRLLVDGGPVDESNQWTNSVGAPVWSPDGRTLTYSHGGLNLIVPDTGLISTLLSNQVDTSAGFPILREMYKPIAYSPDGSKLLVNIGFYEGGTYGIYFPSNNALLRFTRADGGMVCCYTSWTPDGSGIYITNPSLGMMESGLFYADTVDGRVTTLLPGAPPNGTYNFAYAAQVGPDGHLYFFFNNLSEIPASGIAPLFLVRSTPDGVTGRSQLLPQSFQNITEVLWAPDASLAVVVSAPDPYQEVGGQARIIYPDGRAGLILTPSAQDLRWGP
jgi:Tol biopolymer transport system component